MERQNEIWEALLRPKSVAIPGCSDPESGKSAGMPLKYLLSHKYAGDIYPVNPNRQEISGLTCFPTLSAIPGPVDVVICMVPPDQILAVIADATSIRAKAVIVCTSSKDVTNEEIGELIKGSDTRIVGPNTAGVANLYSGAPLGFYWFLRDPEYKPGSVAIVSQSGGVLDMIAARLQVYGLGLSVGVDLGNIADLQITDAISAISYEGQVDSLIAYVEDIEEPDRLFDTLRSARSIGRPAVVLRPGRTDVGRRAAVSHTGAMVGRFEYFAARCRHEGIILAETIEQACLAVAIARREGAAQISSKPRVGVVGFSGGSTALVADVCESLGCCVPELTIKASTELGIVLKGPAPSNPVDFDGRASQNPSVVRETIQILASQDDLDVILFIANGIGLGRPEHLENLKIAALCSKKPVCIYDPVRETRLIQPLLEAGIPISDDVASVIRALKALGAANEDVRVGKGAGKERKMGVRSARRGRPGSSALLAEIESKAIARSLGMEASLARPLVHLDELRGLDWPKGVGYFIKSSGNEFPHRSKLGLVLGPVWTLDDADAGVRELEDRLRTLGAKDRSILVDPVVAPVLAEILITYAWDYEGGPCLLVGRGGSSVELSRDYLILACPLTPSFVRDALNETAWGSSLLVRAGDLGPGIPETIAKFGNYAAQRQELLEVELNPVLLTGGGTLVAVDALATIEQ